MGVGRGPQLPGLPPGANSTAAGYAYRVVNAGISGDTTTGGLARIGSVLALRPAIVILELGANDGLRGIPVASSQANLDQMIVALRKAGAAGGAGRDDAAPELRPRVHPLLRTHVHHAGGQVQAAADPVPARRSGRRRRYMQDDGLHPNAEGNRLVAANVLKTLDPLLKKGTDAFF